MKMLTSYDFNEIRNWIYRNARQIQLTRWQYEFEDGSEEAVIDALAFYQNEDGGFGNTLEPDNWNPNSTPYTTAYAIEILKLVGLTDKDHPIMKGIMQFLESGEYCHENGWQFTILTNEDYPCALWWAYKFGDEMKYSGTTAALVCFILEYAEIGSSLYKKAIAIAKKLIRKLRVSVEDLDGGGVIMLETLEKLGLISEFNAEFLVNYVDKAVESVLVRDPTEWSEVCWRPSFFIKNPNSQFYDRNREVINLELDWLIKTRQVKGVWDIPWKWYREDEESKRASAISENWWRSIMAIENMRFLRSFDRVELV